MEFNKHWGNFQSGATFDADKMIPRIPRPEYKYIMVNGDPKKVWTGGYSPVGRQTIKRRHNKKSRQYHRTTLMSEVATTKEQDYDDALVFDNNHAGPIALFQSEGHRPRSQSRHTS